MTDTLLRLVVVLGNWATAVGCASLAYMAAVAGLSPILIGALAVGAVHFATQEAP